MNDNLKIEIIKHIFNNLGIIDNNFNYTYNKSLKSKEFLLDEKLKLEDENGLIILNDVWGCQFLSYNQELKILLTNCAENKKDFEYSLLVQMNDTPAYGIFLDLDENQNSYEPMIACSLNEKDWLPCNTYLQATFLAGMEQLKELKLSWNICQSYQEQYKLLLSFLEYHNSFYEAIYEGEEIR